MSLKRYEDVVFNHELTPVSAASVSVLDHLGVPVALFDENSAAIANPVITDGNGNFYFYVPAGYYTLLVSGGAPPISPTATQHITIPSDGVDGAPGAPGPPGPAPTGAGNKVLATPSDGSSGVSALRNLVAADIPVLAESKITGLVSDIAAITASILALATVATTGAYSDLTGKPTIPAAQVNTDWNAVSGLPQLLNKPTTWAWGNLTGVPSFATVATSGAYTDLSGLPTLAATIAAVSHKFLTAYNSVTGVFTAAQPAYSDITGTPALATVATSGAYADLTGKPTLAATKAVTAHQWLASYDSSTGLFTQTQPAYSDISGTPSLATVATSGAYSDLTGKPTLAATKAAVSHQFFTAYDSSTGLFTAAQPAYADISGTPTIPTSFTWDVEGNAAGNLSINNAGFTSTFNQTSAVAWLWANTTIATVSTTNASPVLSLAANYWTGAASAVDTWTIGSSLAAGTNGVSTLTIAHTGTTGQSVVLFPAGASTKPSLGFSGMSAGAGLWSVNSGAIGLSPALYVQTLAGVTTLGISASGQGALVGVGTDAGALTSGTLTLYGNSNNTTVVTLGNINANTLHQNSGLNVGVLVGVNSTSYGNLIWNPTAGTSTFTALQVQPTINNTAVLVSQAITSCSIASATAATLTVTTGTNYNVGATIVVSGLSAGTNTQLNGTWVVASTAATTVTITGSGWTTHGAVADTGTLTQTPGAYTALKINAIETSLGGGPSTAHRLIDCYAGAAGATPIFSVDNKGTLVLASQTAPTSAGTAGTAGQIMRSGALLYFCSVTGAAGAATWNKLTMSVV